MIIPPHQVTEYARPGEIVTTTICVGRSPFSESFFDFTIYVSVNGKKDIVLNNLFILFFSGGNNVSMNNTSGEWIWTSGQY